MCWEHLEGNKTHGRTGGFGIGNDAEALRTRLRSKASKVNVCASCFGTVWVARALKNRLGNEAGWRRKRSHE